MDTIDKHVEGSQNEYVIVEEETEANKLVFQQYPVFGDDGDCRCLPLQDVLIDVDVISNASRT